MSTCYAQISSLNCRAHGYAALTSSGDCAPAVAYVNSAEGRDSAQGLASNERIALVTTDVISSNETARSECIGKSSKHQLVDN